MTNYMTFTENDKLKALAIVNIFETSRVYGDYAACGVLNDGAGVSYGINQFTHRSGSLARVVEAYLNGGGQTGKEVFEDLLPTLKKKSIAAITQLAADRRFRKALRSAAVTEEMRSAQRKIAFRQYLQPALKICAAHGFVTPLSLAVVYDSVTHGSWEWISARVTRLRMKTAVEGGLRSEQEWITDYVRKRHRWLTDLRRLRPTSYRTKFFLDQIAIGNWDLKLPMTVHGVRLTDEHFGPDTRISNENTGAEPNINAGDNADLSSVLSENNDNGMPVEPSSEKNIHEFPSAPASQTSADLAKNVFESTGQIISSAAENFDRVDGVFAAVSTRKDAAKSLWTTVLGTFWQALWGVVGFIIGLPRIVWIVVAIIAATLMLAYLYRQIALGKIRENLRLAN